MAPHGSWQVGIASPRLRPFVDAYIGYRTRQPDGLHRGVPNGRMTFIVSLADDIEVVRQVDPDQAPARYGWAVGGLHTTPALIARGGVEEGIAIELSPLGSRALLGVPAAALHRLTVDAADLVGRAVAAELRDRLHARTSWQERFDDLDDVLGRLLVDRSLIARPVVHAWRLLDHSGGRLSIGQVAAQVGWSRRHLGTAFRNEFGASPKEAARAIRFGRTVAHLRAHPHDLAAAAAACGFADQPHLTREFRAMAGCTPAAWLAEEVPSGQDEVGVGPT